MRRPFWFFWGGLLGFGFGLWLELWLELCLSPLSLLPLAGEGAPQGADEGAFALASGGYCSDHSRRSVLPSPQPPLRAPALALAQGRSMGSEPVVRKLPLSPRLRERGFFIIGALFYSPRCRGVFRWLDCSSALSSRRSVPCQYLRCAGSSANSTTLPLPVGTTCR